MLVRSLRLHWWSFFGCLTVSPRYPLLPSKEGTTLLPWVGVCLGSAATQIIASGKSRSKGRLVQRGYCAMILVAGQLWEAHSEGSDV